MRNLGPMPPGARVGMLAVALFVATVPFASSASFAEGCRTRSAAVVIDLDNRSHARILDHVWDAIRVGHPTFLHIDREQAQAHRRVSLRGIPTRRGYDRDEYPPAASREGGRGADVRYVRSAENRSAGSVMGRQLRGWCDGQRFRFERP